MFAECILKLGATGVIRTHGFTALQAVALDHSATETLNCCSMLDSNQRKKTILSMVEATWHPVTSYTAKMVETAYVQA